MQEFKKNIIHQNINDRYFKIELYADDIVCNNFIKFILTPEKNELIKEFIIVKIVIKNNVNSKSYFHFACSLDKNENDIHHFFRENICNGIVVKKSTIFHLSFDTDSYKRCLLNQKRGKDYEKYIFALLKNKNYNIIHNCLKLEKEDQGIDFIAIKNSNVIFIQCKNFENTKVTHHHLKEFYANCEIYLKNNDFGEMNKRFLFLTSKDCLDNSAIYFLKENDFIEYHVLAF